MYCIRDDYPINNSPLLDIDIRKLFQEYSVINMFKTTKERDMLTRFLREKYGYDLEDGIYSLKGIPNFAQIGIGIKLLPRVFFGNAYIFRINYFNDERKVPDRTALVYDKVGKYMGRILPDEINLGFSGNLITSITDFGF